MSYQNIEGRDQVYALIEHSDQELGQAQNVNESDLSKGSRRLGNRSVTISSAAGSSGDGKKEPERNNCPLWYRNPNYSPEDSLQYRINSGLIR